MQRLIDVGRAWVRPVLLGEFGASGDGPDGCSWLREIYDVLDENLGLTDPDGTERSLIAEVVRPYPRAVDGRIERFAWDAAAHRFELEVSEAGPGVSEMWLAPRHLGRSPRVEIVGAESHAAGDGVWAVQALGPRGRMVAMPGANA